jgi:hypothetical protein
MLIPLANLSFKEIAFTTGISFVLSQALAFQPQQLPPRFKVAHC